MPCFCRGKSQKMPHHPQKKCHETVYIPEFVLSQITVRYTGIPKKETRGATLYVYMYVRTWYFTGCASAIEAAHARQNLFLKGGGPLNPKSSECQSCFEKMISCFVLGVWTSTS